MRNQKIGKNVRDLGLRYLMICVFMFMCVPLFSINASLIKPLLGVFYFAALIYYFWFTMKTEGGLDVNRVRIGQVPRFRWKGAVCALFLVVPMMIICLVPLTFHDPIDPEFRAYFTGESVSLKEQDRFNQILKDVSGKEGYVSSIKFTTEGDIVEIAYNTTGGYTVYSLDESVSPSKRDEYYIDVMKDGKPERISFYLSDGEPALEKMEEAHRQAFKECVDGLRKVNSVPETRPLANWQVAWNVVKMIVMSCLTTFCAIFSKSNPILTALIYCLCLVVLVAAAQIGYDMGYNGVEILGKKKPVKDGKAGDSVVIQRGGSKKE